MPFYLIGIAFFLLTFSFAKEKVSYLQASSIATATATVIPTMGLLPAPNARCTRGGLRRKSLSKSHVYAFILYSVRAFVDEMWTNFCPRIYNTMLISLCQWVSSNKNPREKKKEAGAIPASAYVILKTEQLFFLCVKFLLGDNACIKEFFELFEFIGRR